MISIKTLFKWYRALTKRLLKKPSFIFTLLLIPIIALALGIVSNEESGVITVAVSGYDKNDPVYSEISRELLTDDSAILFYEADSPERAINEIYNGKANSAWIFKDNLSERISKYVHDTKSNPLVEVYLVKDSSLYQISREKLYSYLYKNLSYDVFANFMDDRNFTIEAANRENYKRLFDAEKERLNDNIIEFVSYGAPEKKTEDLNYVTSPLKGLLAIAMLLCTLAAMMYSLQDEASGKYSMFPINKRLSIHIVASLSAAVFVAINVFAARLILGDIYFLKDEIIGSVLYVFMITGFCTLVGILCRTPERMCITIPLITVTVIAVCPIFVNFSGLLLIKLLLPVYYYIQATVETKFVLYMLIYNLIIYPLCFVAYKCFNRE